MPAIARILVISSITLTAGLSLACSGLSDAAIDAAAEAIENDPEARAEVEKSLQEALVDLCQKSVDGKGEKKLEEACSCVAGKMLEGKSVKELLGWAQDLTQPAVKKELKRATKACIKS